MYFFDLLKETTPSHVTFHVAQGLRSNYKFCSKSRFIYQNCLHNFSAGADVDNVARNLDFHTLQENIMNITFCNIEGELVSTVPR